MPKYSHFYFQSFSHKPRPLPNPHASVSRVRLSGSSSTIAPLVNDHLQTSVFCTVAKASICISIPYIFSTLLTFSRSASALTYGQLHVFLHYSHELCAVQSPVRLSSHGHSRGRSRPLPSAPRSSIIRVNHPSSTSFASTTTDCTADSVGWDLTDAQAGAEQRLCPNGRFERHCEGTAVMR